MDSFQHRADVSGVFARNLQALVTDQPSISAVCRALEINRTQFNRYLSGEAHPRPEVLQKICAHFGRDARILLTPLAELDILRARRVPPEIDPLPLLTQMHGFDHARMPDGLYRVLMPSYNDPDQVFAGLIRLFTLGNGAKGIHWSVPVVAARLTDKSTRWRDRRQTGICLQHSDGVSMLMASPYTRVLMLYFVSPGYRGLPNINHGFAVFTQARLVDLAPVQPLLIEKINGGLAAAIAFRRSTPFLARGDLTELQRQYFDTWNLTWAPR